MRNKFGVLGAAILGLVLSSCYPDPKDLCPLTSTDWTTIEGSPTQPHSAARVWDELALYAIRQDLPQPTVHSRNLFHLSAAMYDAWSSYDPTAQGVFNSEKQLTGATDLARAEAVSYAGYRVLKERYSLSANKATLNCFDVAVGRAGYSLNESRVDASTAAAIGNRVAMTVLNAAQNDGASTANPYVPQNPNLEPQVLGTTMTAPDHWQALLIRDGFTQNGISQSGPQNFVGANWGGVRPFAMQKSGALYHDPGFVPTQASAVMRDTWIVDLLRKQSQLDAASDATLDISPGVMGNNTLGTNDGAGRALNPITNASYAPQLVKRSDFGRVLAEFWADGPNSETPPGHWNVIANGVVDNANFPRKLSGSGATLMPLEWDVKMYLALNGALHDAAISAWEIKRATTTARPISLVRYMAENDPRGLPLVPGLIEERDGVVQVRGWQSGSGVRWEDARRWVPYQAPSFVTPAFPAFISGHSTFSRAAAEVLTDLTGTAFFPGGLGEVAIPAGALRIDSSPNAALRLQWATYDDAADQAGQSRIWGGIHIEPDDFAGRKIGRTIGLDAVALARKFFAGTAR